MTIKLEQAARQALEVLKGLKTASSIMNDGPDDSDVNYAECIAAEAWDKSSEAITALQEALADVEGGFECPVCRGTKIVRRHFTDAQRETIESAFEKVLEQK